MNIPVRIRISAPTSKNRGDHWVEVSLICESSGCKFARIEMSMEDFTLAAVGSREVVGKAELRLGAPIGKIREYKTELVPRLKRPFLNKDLAVSKEAKKALAPFEVDGWTGRIDDLANSYNWTTDEHGREMARVSFDRFVEVKEPAQ